MTKKSAIFVLDTNKNSREILKSYLKELFPDIKVKLYDNHTDCLKDITESPDSIVFIDLNIDNENYQKVIDKIKISCPKLVITSIDYSTDTIVKAMRLGAKEFLPKPIIKEDLKRVVDMLLDIDTEPNFSNSKIITIFSNKGGIGKTTIATNLAIELTKTTHDKVALVDLNLQLGDISTFLNLNPTFDVNYVIKNLLDKKEETFLNAFEKYKDTNLYILSDPVYFEHAEAIAPHHLAMLLTKLKQVFPYIIVDLSSNIDPNTLKILDLSDWILFTTIVNIPAIRNCQRCINLFKSRHYSKNKIKIIINRYMENDEIKIEDIESTLDEKIYWKIPNNYFSIMEAINKGTSVSDINLNSNIANSFRELATKISDDIVAETITKFRI